MNESAEIVYGRLLESAHLSGYAFERLCAEFEYMLTDNRWREVAGGFSDVNAFVRSIDLSTFNLAEKRPLLVRRIKELQPEVSNRAIAKAIGVGRRTVDRDISVGPNGPLMDREEAVEAEVEGDTGPNGPPDETAREISQEVEESTSTHVPQKIWFEQAPNDIAKVAERQANIANARAAQQAVAESIATAPIKPFSGLYDTIVIDPPWPVSFNTREVRPNQVELAYRRMTIPEIQELVLPMADDCHVWLWTTQHFLPESFGCFEAWGLTYVCCFVWHKPGGMQPMNLPQFNCEFVLYGRKGSPQFLETTAFPTCFNAPRSEHSSKPDEFYNIVRRVTGEKRLDMFGRREIPGFDSWGWEAPQITGTEEAHE